MDSKGPFQPKAFHDTDRTAKQDTVFTDSQRQLIKQGNHQTENHLIKTPTYRILLQLPSFKTNSCGKANYILQEL